ncbi:hypothetical protein I6G96_14145 [Delftia acidovorans]|uniref:hypothetical protein n=1 Tax=Delftia acidovorans TaxID=80866 RepID=UPI0003536CE4|nr:hypothetical protein [Delftia acidovorans]EPD34926.1 hypothetical protein HMPREF9701_05630 [Delftia acidovorans CCUG 274B]PZP71229.1 MAG: hypothetical protein DI604_15545 [Delftia acidovorans]QPR37509.1 hypothetical protein I6G96_14145 [Delftia acidovorans]
MHPLIAAQATSPQLPLLPTWRQAMHASLGLVQSTLQQLIELMVDDPDRDDSEVDVDCAVELALEHIKRMSVQQHADRYAFEVEWIKATAALRLAQGAFGRPESRFGLRLKDAIQQLEMLPELVEFVDQDDGE